MEGMKKEEEQVASKQAIKGGFQEHPENINRTGKGGFREHPENINRAGKGGFQEHPECRSDGRWKKENSFSYWLNFFKSLPINEFREYKVKNPDISMAALAAWARVAKSVEKLEEFREVANRTEGMPTQRAEVVGNVSVAETKIPLDMFILLNEAETGQVKEALEIVKKGREKKNGLGNNGVVSEKPTDREEQST